MLESFNIYQTIEVATRRTQTSSSCIDNIFTNIDNETIKTLNLPVDFSDHDFQVIEIPISTKHSFNNNLSISYKRVFCKSNILAFCETLSNTDFDIIETISDENKFNTFIEIFNIALNTHFPIKKVTRRVNQKHWITKGIRISSKNKKTLYILNKFFNCNFLTSYYKNYCKILKLVIIEAKRMLIKDEIITASNAKKATWEIINREINRNTKSQENLIINVDDSELTNPEDISKNFNNYFLKVISSLSSSITRVNSNDPYKVSFHENTAFFFPTTEDEISMIIKGLKPTSTTGPDEIPVKIIKVASEHISIPLSKIINSCREIGYYPDPLKISKVLPIPKTKNDINITNFRPISNLSVFSKIFETVLKSRIIDFFIKYKLFSKMQHGYQQFKSTDTALQNILTAVYSNLNKNKLTACINCDLSKAFDLINHNILLEKLEIYGIRGVALKLIQSYLNNRRQYVEIRHKESNTWTYHRSSLQLVNAGVPQGSILGPLLFIIFMNDLPDSISEKITIYADDTNVVVGADSPRELESKITAVLIQLAKWYSNNQLVINVKKTNIILFNYIQNFEGVSYEGNYIKFVQSTKILGLYVDSNLKWKTHCEQLCQKLNRSLFALRRLKNMCDFTTLKMIYHAYFDATLKYGIIFWGNSTDSRKIFTIQKKAVRTILGMKSRDSCRTKFQEYKISTVTNLFINQCLIYMFHNNKSFQCSVEVHDYSTRENKTNTSVAM